VKVLNLGALERLERDTRRVGEIVGVLVKYGLADWIQSIPLARVQDWLRSARGQAIPGIGFPERVRLALTDLGTTFIKLGQMLSTRPDLVGLELAEELSQLQSNAPADPPEAIRLVISEDLGKPPEALFADFADTPIASASIAQVHPARLRSGEPVVIKIRKEGIVPRVEADLSILLGLAELAEKYSAELRAYQPIALVRQFHHTLLRELDFTSERRNLDAFRRNFAADASVRFPRPWPETSSRRVLTMERLEGIPGTDPGRLRASGGDLSEFARRGANMYLAMIFRDSFYHADPHPGNLMLLEGGVVGVLDCGMTGRLDEALRDDVEALLLALAQSDPEALTDAVWQLSAVPPPCARDQLKSDLAEFLAEYTAPSLADLDLSAALRSLTEIIRRHHIILPPGASLLLRTLVLLEGTSRRLNPDFSLAEVIQPFYRKAVGRRLSPRRLLRRLQRSTRDWDRLLQALPRDFNLALQHMRAGRFSVQLEHRHLDPVVNRLVLGIMTASLFLGSSLLWSTSAPPLLGGVSVVGAAGYSLAVYLGWRLWRAVRRSGNVDSEDKP
jgi:ubiquinone biosynthesis protein